jgi:urease accessory protein
MRRVILAVPAGRWAANAAEATVTLPFDARHRRRLRMTDDAGRPFLLDLERACALADGDGLQIEGGGFIRVRAAPEAVADVEGATPAATARLAWHIGNRHAPLQVLACGRLRIRDDHVLIAMLAGHGARIVRLTAAFDPEPGAYAGAGAPPHAHADADN